MFSLFLKPCVGKPDFLAFQGSLLCPSFRGKNLIDLIIFHDPPNNKIGVLGDYNRLFSRFKTFNIQNFEHSLFSKSYIIDYAPYWIQNNLVFFDHKVNENRLIFAIKKSSFYVLQLSAKLGSERTCSSLCTYPVPSPPNVRSRSAPTFTFPTFSTLLPHTHTNTHAHTNTTPHTSFTVGRG